MRYASIAIPAIFAAVFAARASITVYPEYPEQIERDYAYLVRVVQGDEKKRLVVYNHCEKSPLTRRTRGGDVNRRFCEFAFDGGEVRVDIAVTEDVESYAVFPSRLGLKSAFNKGVISVWVDKPAMFGIRLNDYDKTILSIFAEAPEDPAKIPQKGAPGVLYVDGWLDATSEDGVIVVEPPLKEVYIAPGAVLNSRLILKTEGAYLHGRGMLLDPLSDVFRFDQRKNTRRGFVNANAKNALVEDVKLVDSRTFNFCSWQRGVTYRNVKALSSMMCSDGITCGGPDFTVDGAWLYVGDNALVISGLKEKALLRDIAIGTSCNAIFPQGSNTGVVLENIDIFRADEGMIKNSYNGVLRRNTKWNEMNSGAAKKEPGPQDLKHQTQEFFFKNLSAMDSVLFSRFFVGGNMGTLPKTFGFENVATPYPTGSDDWHTIGKTGGKIVSIMHDSAKYLDTDNYTLAITNLWMGGARLDAIPESAVKNGDRVSVFVVNKLDKPAIPVAADRHEVNWTCPYKCYIGNSQQHDVRKISLKKGEQRIEQPANGENLLADRPATRSAWQRSPSWLVKFDAMDFEGGARLYRLNQCEKGAGIVNVITDAYLRHGNGTYHLSFDARLRSTAEELKKIHDTADRLPSGNPVKLTARIMTNDESKVAEFDLPPSGEWAKYEADLEIAFDIAKTDLVAISLTVDTPSDEICFKNLSLVRVR